MNQGPIWGRLLKKTRGRQSRASVPIRNADVFWQDSEGAVCQDCRRLEAILGEFGQNWWRFSGIET